MTRTVPLASSPGRIQNLERRLTIGETEDQSDKPSSPVLTPRPDSPSSLPLSPTRPSLHRRESRISLEDELRRSRQAEEVSSMFMFVFSLTSSFFLSISFCSAGGFILYCWYFCAREGVGGGQGGGPICTAPFSLMYRNNSTEIWCIPHILFNALPQFQHKVVNDPVPVTSPI